MQPSNFVLRRLGFGPDSQYHLAFRLMVGETSIGRGMKPPSPLYIHIASSQFVSKEHLRIEVQENGDIHMRDVSTYGTYLNGRLVHGEKEQLRIGDTMALGMEADEGDLLKPESVSLKLELFAPQVVKKEEPLSEEENNTLVIAEESPSNSQNEPSTSNINMVQIPQSVIDSQPPVLKPEQELLKVFHATETDAVQILDSEDEEEFKKNVKKERIENTQLLVAILDSQIEQAPAEEIVLSDSDDPVDPLEELKQLEREKSGVKKESKSVVKQEPVQESKSDDWELKYLKLREDALKEVEERDRRIKELEAENERRKQQEAEKEAAEKPPKKKRGRPRKHDKSPEKVPKKKKGDEPTFEVLNSEDKPFNIKIRRISSPRPPLTPPMSPETAQRAESFQSPVLQEVPVAPAAVTVKPPPPPRRKSTYLEDVGQIKHVVPAKIPSGKRKSTVEQEQPEPKKVCKSPEPKRASKSPSSSPRSRDLSPTREYTKPPETKFQPILKKPGPKRRQSTVRTDEDRKKVLNEKAKEPIRRRKMQHDLVEKQTPKEIKEKVFGKIPKKCSFAANAPIANSSPLEHLNNEPVAPSRFTGAPKKYFGGQKKKDKDFFKPSTSRGYKPPAPVQANSKPTANDDSLWDEDESAAPVQATSKPADNDDLLWSDDDSAAPVQVTSKPASEPAKPQVPAKNNENLDILKVIEKLSKEKMKKILEIIKSPTPEEPTKSPTPEKSPVPQQNFNNLTKPPVDEWSLAQFIYPPAPEKAPADKWNLSPYKNPPRPSVPEKAPTPSYPKVSLPQGLPKESLQNGYPRASLQQGSAREHVQQRLPMGFGQQGPSKGHLQQGLPTGSGQQGPLRGHVQQRLPTSSGQQGPSRGRVQQGHPNYPREPLQNANVYNNNYSNCNITSTNPPQQQNNFKIPDPPSIVYPEPKECFIVDNILKWSPSWFALDSLNSPNCKNAPLQLQYQSWNEYMELTRNLKELELFQVLKDQWNTNTYSKIFFNPVIGSVEKDFEGKSYRVTADLELPASTDCLTLRRWNLLMVEVDYFSVRTKFFAFVESFELQSSLRNKKNWRLKLKMPLDPIILNAAGQTAKVSYVGGLHLDINGYKALMKMRRSVFVDWLLNPQLIPVVKPLRVPKHCFKDNLSSKQGKAVLKISQSIIDNPRNFFIIEGPPGTGKTRLLANLIWHLELSPEHPTKLRILVCSQSNRAVDALVLKLGQMDTEGMLSFVRVGSNKTDPKVRPWFLDHLVNNEVREIYRRTADGFEPTSSFSIQRKTLMKDLKAKRDELKGKQGLELQNLRSELETINKELYDIESSIYEICCNQKKCKPILQEKSSIKKSIWASKDIVCTTLAKALEFDNYEFKHNNQFDILIVDEAGVATEADVVAAMSFGVKHVILVGDSKQLPAVIKSSTAKDLNLHVSLMQRVQTVWKQDPNRIFALSEQYRMHPEIVAFPSKAFYEGRLTTHCSVKRHPALQPYLIFELETEQNFTQSHNVYNRDECDFCLDLVETIRSRRELNSLKIHVLSPYLRQVEEFQKKLKERPYHLVEAVTVDAMQGLESDIVILTTARTEGIGFLSLDNRLNVALTRARHSLFICGNFVSLKKSDIWHSLLMDAQDRQLLVRVDDARDLKSIVFRQV